MFRGCDRCDNPASVHLTEIKGGQKTEKHLCENCARALHVPQAAKELQKLLKSFEPSQQLTRRAATESGRLCPDCGMTWAELRQHGRFGCERDYEVFGQEIERLLRRIHGADRYSGKTPSGGQVDAGQALDVVTRIRRRLDEAIKDEKYEEAAQLRDELAKLRGGEPTAARPPTPPPAAES